jgi:hypothetical protein
LKSEIQTSIYVMAMTLGVAAKKNKRSFTDCSVQLAIDTAYYVQQRCYVDVYIDLKESFLLLVLLADCFDNDSLALLKFV